WTAIRTRPAAAHLLAILITLYGGLLRLDAFAGRYGTLDHPAWARTVTEDVAPIAASVRPSGVLWGREARPYVGGDPINYLRFAREMKGFYQAHVREPVFLALTRGWLVALDGQDAAVSFASITGSTLTIAATYLAGAALLSPLTGLLAALLMAIEYEAITWAPGGWRDDTFTATVLFAAWALLRLRERPSLARAVIAGVLCGVACLTRLTALSFVVPGLLWLVADRAVPARRERARFAGVALLVLAAVVGPFLISCARATGDPLYAVNYHTLYYRFAEGRSIAEPMTVGEYLRLRISERPVATFDTGTTGLFVQPFVTKWNGFAPWGLALSPILPWLGVAGLAALPFFPAGRLLLVILLSSLLPYVFTWNVAGGGEWRFTMHAYPFYLLAASCALVGTIRAARAVARDPALLRRPVLASLAARAGAILVVAALGLAAHVALPWFVTREAIAHGDSTSVETGSRDLVFYRSGWSPPRPGNITVRVSVGERSVVRLPLPAKIEYDLVLRLDPVDPAAQEQVTVLFNRRLVGTLRLSSDPERMGSYRVRLREDLVKVGSNELTIIPHTLVEAGSAGPQFAWLDAAERIGVRLWYVRVLPSPPTPP
ncbi:MAG TPA: glycosyltransferase family 39 protein, partial [Longimicrobiales bacterium]|nr:glycosyltransferase family 39 protein [Longimicrobiales bacterium]